ncbi:MAG: hypothetical protein U5M51_17035, partial [Emticicia sp.]|nr:hypothetical protein [Emticicia sp.]
FCCPKNLEILLLYLMSFVKKNRPQHVFLFFFKMCSRHNHIHKKYTITFTAARKKIEKMHPQRLLHGNQQLISQT